MNNLKAYVVKVGGDVLADADATDALWRGVAQLRDEAPVVFVHGGGTQATALAERFGHEPRVVQGRRVTTDLDLEVAQWALRGALSTRLVAQAGQHGMKAVGLSGADGGLLRVTKRPPRSVNGDPVDFGWVGDVERVEPGVLRTLLDGGLLPVVAPLGIDEAGQVYNVNADTVACALAAALGARRLLLVTTAGSVRQAAGTRLSHCDASTFEAGVEAGWIRGGMRVKLRAALQACEDGVGEALVLGPADLVACEDATRVAPER
jgi:acetylglutamate kinase